MKIVHISDLHIDAVYKRTNYLKAIQLLEYITDTGFDHLIISGDLTENAEKSAFELTRKTLKKFGLLNSSKLSLVIGNHDIFGGVHLAEDVLNFPKKCKNTNYNDKVSEFNYYFREVFERTGTFKNNLYPFVKEFDETVFIGLNTIAKYSVIKNPFASNGAIYDEQISAFETLLAEKKYKDKVKIVIAHHHFCKDPIEESNDSTMWQKIERQTMKLRNKKSIIKLLSKCDIKMVLHGHIHETTEYNRKGIKFLNAGGSVLNSKPDEMKINVIHISNNNSHIETQTIPFNTSNPSPIKIHNHHKSSLIKDFSLN